MATQRIFLTVLFVLTATALSTSQDRRSGDWETLEGTWIVEGTAVGFAPRLGWFTFARGGTITAFSNAPAPTSRSPSYGVWARRSYLEFLATFGSWRFNAAGNSTGRQEDRMAITVDRRLETLSADGQTLFYDVSGNLVNTVRVTYRGTRVNVKAPE